MQKTYNKYNVIPALTNTADPPLLFVWSFHNECPMQKDNMPNHTKLNVHSKNPSKNPSKNARNYPKPSCPNIVA